MQASFQETKTVYFTVPLHFRNDNFLQIKLHPFTQGCDIHYYPNLDICVIQ